MEINISIKIIRTKNLTATKCSNNYAAVRFEPLTKEEINILHSMSSSLNSSSDNTS